MTKFLNWTKKQQREFNRLPPEEKEKVLEVAIAQAVSNKLAKFFMDFTISGELIRSNELYTRYVKELDNMTVNSFEWAETVERLLSDIRVGYLNYKQKYEGTGADDGQQTD